MGRKFVKRVKTHGEWNRIYTFCVVLFGKKVSASSFCSSVR